MRAGCAAAMFGSILLFSTSFAQHTTVEISKESLQDKIKGGWAGQVIGCTFGGPTEFRYRQTFIPDYQPITWYDGYMKWYYENIPGLYDDIYMDLTFVEVFEKDGLDAPVEKFAHAYANAGYMLWHANQAARYNILNGIMPPESGHWLNNPHADDIDFQIEADFAGLMSPGMVNTASEICDKIGHIMNYGDGWYGGVYVAAMYSLAFISNDVDYIVEEALKTIPEESAFAKTMKDVIIWHREYPEDWKLTWFKTIEKWGRDVGCPEGVFTPFNIDAKINAAWIILGLLYGEGDFGRTISISARSGDDSDCNPASSGGIVATMLGYSNIPAYWKQGLAEVEPMDFKYTTMSLNDTYEMSCRHALGIIERNGGRVGNDYVSLKTQKPVPVRLEQGFQGHFPTVRKTIGREITGETTLEFEGIGFVITGGAAKKDEEYVFNVEMYIDGRLAETTSVPTEYRIRKPTLFWKYQLPEGRHTLRLKILNPSAHAEFRIEDMIIYAAAPLKAEY